MDSPASPYYPPRARWYSSLWRWWYPVKRRLYLDRVPRFARHEVGQALLGVVLPGWALLWSKRPILGVILGVLYCLSAAVFLVWVGHPISNLALTVMISIHAGSILRIEQSVGLGKRLLHSVGMFLAVAGVIYVPLRSLMERHWFMPLQINGRVVVVRTGRTSALVKRGDLIAYRLQAVSLPGLRAGWGVCTVGRVMAAAGDEVAFDPEKAWINRQSYPRLSQMPTNGTVQVDQGCWFIWPEMAIRGAEYADAGTIQQAMMRLANVSEAAYVGVVYQRWLWREQTLP